MFSGSLFDVGVLATVMLHGVAGIPAVNAVGDPGASDIWQFMNDNVGSG